MSWLLPIAALPPEAAAIIPGRLYALLHEGDAALRPTLRAMLEAGNGEALWLLSGEGAHEAAAAMGTGVRPFLWERDRYPELAARLLEELEHFGVAPGTAVVVEGADRLFAELPEGAREAVLRASRRWAEARGCALLLLFPRRADAPDVVPSLTRSADGLAGFARLRRAAGGLSWDIFHWLGGGRAAAAQSLPLIEDGAGRFALGETGAGAPVRETAPDEAVVIAEAGVAAGVATLPATWQVEEGMAALLETAQKMSAATIIFAFDRQTSLEALSRAVFALRRECGNELKIVVREVDSHLRYSREQLLLHLGANLVVPAEVVFSRFLSLVGMVQGQRFSRTLEADYESAVAGAVPAPERGYLVPAGFTEAVAEALERMQTLGIESVLVRLPLIPGLVPLDALRYCLMKRPGDLCTADEDSLYLFLFACRESDVAATLARLFRLPVGDLFEGEVRYYSIDTIGAEVKALGRRAAHEPMPDLSAALAEVGGAGEAVAPPEKPSPERAGPVRGVAPVPAQRRALKLRADTDIKEARA